MRFVPHRILPSYSAEKGAGAYTLYMAGTKGKNPNKNAAIFMKIFDAGGI
jgi:hypothetical protein